MRKQLLTLAAAAALSLVGITRADEVVFNNGDKITGTVTVAEGGKLKVKSAVAGEITVDLADVKTFTTTAPVDLRLKDGSKVTPAPAAAADGGVNVGGQVVPFANVSTVNPPFAVWTGSVTAGLTLVRGNTRTSDYNVGYDATRRTETDRITTSGLYVLGRTGSTSTKENLYLQGQYDYFLNEKLYVYGRLRFDKDRFQDLEYRFSPGVGVGYQWFESPKDKFNFNTEAGLTYVYEKYDVADDINNYLAGRLAYHFDMKLNDKVSVFHNLEYLPSLSDVSQFLINADAGIRADIAENFFVEGKVVVNYNNTPANEATQETDHKYLISLGYKF